MKIAIFILVTLPIAMLLGLGLLELSSQSNIIVNVRKSANLAVRSAAQQIDLPGSAAGKYVIKEGVAKQVFDRSFRSFLGLDNDYQGEDFNGPVDVKVYVINYSKDDPLPKTVNLPGWEGVVKNSSVIAVINYSRNRLIPWPEPMTKKIVAVEQAQLRP